MLRGSNFGGFEGLEHVVVVVDVDVARDGFGHDFVDLTHFPLVRDGE